jgi:hypothetical protein
MTSKNFPLEELACKRTQEPNKNLSKRGVLTCQEYGRPSEGDPTQGIGCFFLEKDFRGTFCIVHSLSAAWQWLFVIAPSVFRFAKASSRPSRPDAF